MLVWETHAAHQQPRAAELGSPISSAAPTFTRVPAESFGNGVGKKVRRGHP